MFCFGSHDNLRLQDAGFDLLVWENDASVAVNLIAYMHILSEDGHVLDAGPLPDSGVPSDDAAGDAGMLLDADTTHNCAAGEPHP